MTQTNANQAKVPADRETLVTCVDWTLRERRTFKVLGSIEQMRPLDPRQRREFDIEVDKSIEAAGWAPFHYARNADSIAEPWRFYILRQGDCQRLAVQFHDVFTNVKPGTILPRALAACGCLVLATWIPEDSISDSAKLEKVNLEHLAAASAAVHSLTLALQARGLGAYWSSGGMLGDDAFFERLGIPVCEKLLAALFIESPASQLDESLERIPGKQRANRSSPDRWSRDVNF